MNERNILIIKNSWSYLITKTDEVGALFYQKLFELDPVLKPMFQNDIDSQIQKFTDMITFMVLKLQNMTEFQRDLNSLAARHVGYGTQPKHYQVTGKALLLALEGSLGEMWDNETNSAWTELYDFIALSMIKASGSHT
jgi:hemoglobin-like flavoprotein